MRFLLYMCDTTLGGNGHNAGVFSEIPTLVSTLLEVRLTMRLLTDKVRVSDHHVDKHNAVS